MKSRTKNFTQSLLVLLCSMLILSGCVKEQVESNPIKDGEKEVVFAIHVPSGAGASSQSPKTRAIVEDSDDDNYVKEVDILMFNSAGKFLQNVWCENVDQSVGFDIKVKNVKVRLPKGTGYTFVLLANSHQFYIANALDAGDDIIKMHDLAASLGAFGTKWNSIPGHANYRRFPMWGQISGVTIDGTSKTFNVDAYRMFAKVNVAVDYSQSADFELQSVAVYNYNKSGFLVPDATKFAAGKPTEKIDREAGGSPSPLFYSNTNSDGIGGVNYSYINDNTTVRRYECIDEIFIPESAVNTGAWAWDNNTCIVIGGTYKGRPAYYRMDFVKNNVNIDVRRNWKYLFEVGTIKTPGYGDEETALKNQPDNIEYTVHPWDEQNIGDLIVEGAIQLTVSPKSTVTFSRDPETQGVGIYTNWSKGWQVQKRDYNGTEKYRIEDAGGNHIDWITLDNYGTTAAGEKALKITVTNNDSGAERKGFIHITTKGDRIQYRLTVVQRNVARNSLTAENALGVAIDVLEFSEASGVAPGEQRYKVKWAPKSETLYIGLAPVANPDGGVYDPLKWTNYNTNSGTINNSGTTIWTTPIDNGTGEVEFTIKPSPITHGVDGVNLTTNPFYERSQQINFRAIGSDGAMRKSVILQQMVRNMQPSAEGFYIADGSPYTFNVKSNRPWKAYLEDNGGGIVTSPAVNSATPFATGGYNLPAGANVGFTTFEDISNPTLISGTAKVRIEWLSGDDAANSAHWTSSSIDLMCGSGTIQPPSNSYIVAPGDIGIFIPVSRANESMLGIQLGANEAFTAELVWTDNANRIAANSNIKTISAAGSGTTGYVLVVPGEAPGNAVVAIKNAANKILWSWHIWVTGYNPLPIGTGKFMDRNLGALSNAATTNIYDISAKGLLYQWGRKDAFPGSATLNGNIDPVLYTATGTTVVTQTQTPELDNFGNAVANPATIYFNNNKPYDWYTYGSTQNNALWGPASKTVYDPCPAGWRVPINGVWATLTTANFPWGNYGRTAASHGGFYPAAGCRSTSSGWFYAIGTGGLYWSATADGIFAHDMLITVSVVAPSNHTNRASAFSIRCVQE